LDARNVVADDKVCYVGSRRTKPDMKIELYKDAALARDLPEHGLRRGDILKVVDHHIAADGTEGYSAEIINATGETLDVVTIPEDALQSLRDNEILCARTFSK